MRYGSRASVSSSVGAMLLKLEKDVFNGGSSSCVPLSSFDHLHCVSIAHTSSKHTFAP
jgi:hypothetical protein